MAAVKGGEVGFVFHGDGEDGDNDGAGDDYDDDDERNDGGEILRVYHMIIRSMTVKGGEVRFILFYIHFGHDDDDHDHLPNRKAQKIKTI